MSEQCRYCGRPVDSAGGINHVGGCAGLEKVELNRLQYDALVARGAGETQAEHPKIDNDFEARVAHVVGEAAKWRPGSGTHPPELMKALNELTAYYYTRIYGEDAFSHPTPPKTTVPICSKCETELAFEGDVCGLCNPVAQP